MRATCFAFLLLLVCQSAFSQSKKEQIESLIFQKDSLLNSLLMEREISKTYKIESIRKIQSLNNSIKEFEFKVLQLDLNIEEKDENEEVLQKQIKVLTDSIKNFVSHDEYLRKLIIDKYLKNKTFGIKYYRSYTGVGPDGGSITTILEQNGKFHIEDMRNGGPPLGTQKIEIVPNEQLANFSSWKFAIDDKLKYFYTDGDQVVSGKVSYLPVDWSEYFRDSTFSTSIIFSEKSIKVPIGIINLETIRGVWDFYVYFLIGREEFSFPLIFNRKKYFAFNPIVLESQHVTIIMSEIE